MADIIIRNEEDAIRELDRALEGAWHDNDVVKFSGWPNFEITIRGEKFDGGVPTRIMPVLIELQKLIDNTYSKYKYGEVKRLSKKDRLATEIVVKLSAAHSTDFLVEIFQILNNFAKQKIEIKTKKIEVKTSAAVILLALSLTLGTAGSLTKMYLQNLADEREYNINLKQNEKELKYLEIIENFANKDNEVKELLDKFSSMNKTLVKKLDEKDVIVSNGEEIITGEEAQKIQRKKPEPTVTTKLSGKFVILNVNTMIGETGFKLKIQDEQNKKIYSSDLSLNALTKEQLESLKNGEWDKTAVSLNLEIRTRGNRFVGGRITGVNDSAS